MSKKETEKEFTVLAEFFRAVINRFTSKEGENLNTLCKKAEVDYQALHPFVSGKKKSISFKTGDKILKATGEKIKM